MKMADVVVGEEYAYRSTDYGSFERVLVLKTKVFRGGVYRHGSFRSGRSERADGVYVVLLGEKDGQPRMINDGWGAVMVRRVNVKNLMPRYFHMTWAEHLEVKAANKAFREKRDGQQDVLRLEIKEMLDRLPEEIRDFFRVESRGEPKVYLLGSAEMLARAVVDAIG